MEASMGVRRGILVIAFSGVVFGCSDSDRRLSPTAPTPGPSAPTDTPPASTDTLSYWVWGFVIGSDGGGACVDDATVEILDGERVGEVVDQQAPCSAWDYPPNGFSFEGLSAGSVLTLRASAPGYFSKRVVVVARNGGYGDIIELRRRP